MQDTQNNFGQQKPVLCLPWLPIANAPVLMLFRRSMQEHLEKLWLDAEELPGLYAQHISPQLLARRLLLLASEARFLANKVNVQN